MTTVFASSGIGQTAADTNLARGKSYTFSARPNYAHCTDPGDATQLTDGIYTQGYFWTQKSTVGWQGGGPVAITIDLGQIEPISGVSFNTAAGVAGVTWPTGIAVLVSDDGHAFYEAGELLALSAEHGRPPRTGYATHRFWTQALRAHGRYVMLVVTGGHYLFADEIEVHRGEPGLLAVTPTGPVITDGIAFANQQRVRQSVERRLRLDTQAVRELADQTKISGAAAKEIRTLLAEVEAGIPNLPRQYGEDFRAVLPLNALHQQVFRAQAALWRAVGAGPLTVWSSPVWDPLDLIHAAPKAGAQVDVALMQNEFRAGAFNLSNATETDQKLTLKIVGLPGGTNPDWITVHEVQWLDTKSGQPVAAALPVAERVDNGYHIQAPAGLTRQVWLTFHPVAVLPGEHMGRITLTDGAQTLEVPVRVRVHSLRFPERPSLHLGGWDYTDTEGRDITPANRDLVIAHLQERFVDSPWATSGVMPAGKFGDDDQFTVQPDTTQFDRWLERWPNAVRYCVFSNVRGQFAGVKMGTPTFEKRVGTWIRFWAQHAQQRGLRPEQLALLLLDEPTTSEQDAIILAWTRAIHAAGTGVKIWEDPIHADPFAANQEMLAACDVLCPNRTKFLAEAKYRDYFATHRPPNVELAFYSCSNPLRLLDPYSYIRLQAWSCWQQGARSSYFWAFSDSGGGSSWNEYASRGPSYTPFLLDAASVTPGKHMEALRESAEDYEYLVMLRDKIATLEQQGKNPSALERGRQLLTTAAHRVLSADGASDLSWFATKDRTVADQVRREILDVLTALEQ